MFPGIHLGASGSSNNRFPNAIGINELQATVSVSNTEAVGNPSMRARLGGFFCDSNNTADNQLGEIFADNSIISQTNGALSFRYLVFRCDNSDCTNGTDLLSNTFGSAQLNTDYTLTVAFDPNTRTFTFSVDGSDALTFGPGDDSALQNCDISNSEFKTIGTRVFNDDPNEGGSITATFDDVFVNGVLYDDFNSGILDPSQWRDTEGRIAVETENGNRVLRIEQKYAGLGRGFGVEFNNPDIINTIRTDVRIDSTNIVATDGNGRVRARITGVFYNDGSSTGFRDQTGDVFAEVFMRREFQNNQNQFRIRCDGIRSDNADFTEDTEIFFESFTATWVEGQTYQLMLGFDPDNKTFTCGFEDQMITYTLQPNDPQPNRSAVGGFKSIRTRIDSLDAAGERGEISVVFDNVQVSPPIPITPTTTLESNQVESQLGFAVADAGDINGDGFPDLIAGLPLFDAGQNNEGVAQLFLGTADGVSNTVFQQLEANQIGAQFGFAVAGIGDINNDNFDDVAVGAPFFTGGEKDEGAVFIYLGSPNGLVEPPLRILQSNQAGAMMGFSVAGVGDINDDGFDDLGMGLPGFNANVQNRQARGLEGPTGAIAALLGGLLNATNNNVDIIIPGIQAGEMLGSSIAGAGDVNGDGPDDIIAGAPGFNNGNIQNAGAARVYPGSNSGPQTTAIAQFLGTLANEALGSSVIGIGDPNRDGFADVAVGAPGFGRDEDEEGAVHIYLGGVNPSPAPALTLESNNERARMGESVARLDDLNNDGEAEIFAGAPGYSRSQPEEGAAFIFESNVVSLYDETPRQILEGGQPDAAFGSSVAQLGSLNSRGFAEVVASSPLSNRNEVNAGQVDVFALSRPLLLRGTKERVENNLPILLVLVPADSVAPWMT